MSEPTATTAESPLSLVRLIIALVIGVIGLCLLAGLAPVVSGLGLIFHFVAHQFYEMPQLAGLRAASQMALLKYHIAVWLIVAATWLVANQKFSPEMQKIGWVLLLGWALRAGAWIAGGNLPLIPGDSSHYIETANSVALGLPSSKHYVESFFKDYPPIRAGRPVLDDWATPLYADCLGFIFRMTGSGIGPEKNLEMTFGLAKGLSFIFNLLTLPALYLFVRRHISASAALPSMALAAILPVHVIYAGMELRESLVGLTSLLAVWLAHEFLSAKNFKSKVILAIVAGIASGLAILSRNTAMVLVLCLGLWLLWYGGKKQLVLMPVWAGCVLIVIAPWAWLTFKAYGKPFYSYTEHFAHTFSWTVHHYAAGLPDVKKFYATENLPELVRVKIKSIFILFGYSIMILSPPVVLGFYFRVRKPLEKAGRNMDTLALLLFTAFAAATVARIADVTQVAQLGRYYMPIYLLMLPTAVRGLMELKSAEFQLSRKMKKLGALALVGCLWADPTWAYDASWFVKPFQLHWPGLVDAGKFIQEHPEAVPPEARVMSWFPWEMRVTSNRITVLMPRSYDARRIREVMDQYGVTHVIWGSFETPQHVDPESFGPYLTGVKAAIGLSESNEIYRTPRQAAGLYPVTIHRRTGP